MIGRAESMPYDRMARDFRNRTHGGHCAPRAHTYNGMLTAANA